MSRNFERRAVPCSSPQRILVLQQAGSGESKIRGIRQFGGERFSIATYAIDAPLPDLIEDGGAYLPQSLAADIVLDYLLHPDLSLDLWTLCQQQGLPVVAAGKKGAGQWAITPPICCALPRVGALGEYGRLFGAPEFQVTVRQGRIAEIDVVRGAPCGATWAAAQQIIGHRTEEAPVLIGLHVQYCCTADPAGWDVLHGRSPVHLAAALHQRALEKALGKPL